MYRINYLGAAIVLILSMLAFSSCSKSNDEKHPVDKPVPSPEKPAKWYTDKVIDLTPKIIKERITEEFDEKTAKIGPDRNKIAYKGDRPCVIDFSSVGCRFCDMMKPIIKKSAAVYAGQVYIYLYVEQRPMNGHSPMMDFFGFHQGAYPSFVFVDMNGTIERYPGYLNEELFNKKIEKLIDSQQK